MGGGARRGAAGTARSGYVGLGDDASGRPLLRISVTAAPVDGAANRALIDILAGSLELLTSDVTIRSGATARTKHIHLVGDAASLIAWLADAVTPWNHHVGT